MDNKNIKIFGALAHLAGWFGIIGLIFSIILLVSEDKSRRSKILGFQGLFWVIAVWIIMYVLTAFLVPFGLNPFTVGWAGIGAIIINILYILVLVYSIILSVKIYHGKEPTIPLISDWARKVAKE